MNNNLAGETHRPGRIEVVCGSMFSGKTEELIRRMKRAKFAKQKVEIFKPSLDTRYSDVDVVSHDQHSIPSTPIDSSSTIALLSSDIDVVGIAGSVCHCRRGDKGARHLCEMRSVGIYQPSARGKR